MKQILTIHPANDMFGRWWVIFKGKEEIKSFDRDNWTIKEVKKKLEEQFEDIKIIIDGTPIK